MWGRIAGRGRRRGRRRQNGRSRWQAHPCCCKTARVQSVEARVPEKLTISGYTDSSPLDVVLVRACDLLARTAIPRRTLGPALGVIFMLCCVLSCVAVSLGGCYIFTPAAATYFVFNFSGCLDEAMSFNTSISTSLFASPKFYAPNAIPLFVPSESWPWLSSCETFDSRHRSTVNLRIVIFVWI